jgi:hypothetical protein
MAIMELELRELRDRVEACQPQESTRQPPESAAVPIDSAAAARRMVNG